MKLLKYKTRLSLVGLFISLFIPLIVAVIEVSASTEYPAGMISYWKFDEGSGTIANDIVGTNPGNIYGGTWTLGQVGSALSFDGSGDYVQIPNAPELNPQSEMTIESWVYIEKDGRNIYKLFDKDGYWSDQKGYSGHIGAGGTEICLEFFNPYRGLCYTPPGGFPDRTWVHFAFTYDGIQIQLIYNGDLVSSVAKTGSINQDANRDLYIGHTDNRSEYQKGMLDEFAIYNRALTAQEIQQHYQNGLAGLGYGSETPTPTATPPPTLPPCHIINARDFEVVTVSGSPTDSHTGFTWHNFDQSPPEVEIYTEANAVGLSVRQNITPSVHILANTPSDTYRVWIYQMDSPDPWSRALETTVGTDAPVTTHFVHASWSWQDVGVHTVSPGTKITVKAVGAFINHGQDIPERRGAFKGIYLTTDMTTQPPDFVPDGQSSCTPPPPYPPCHTINARDFEDVVVTGSPSDSHAWFTWHRFNQSPPEVETYGEANAVGLSVRQNIYPDVNTTTNVPAGTYRVWIYQMDTYDPWSRALETTVGTDAPVTTHFDSSVVGYYWAWQDVGLHTVSPGTLITVKAVGAFINHGQDIPERRGAFKAIYLTNDTTTQPPDFIPDGTSSCTPVPVNLPPIALADGPYSGDEGATINLTGAAASDPDQDPLTYNWSVDNPVVCSFDDGSTLNPNLTCSDDGFYEVTLTVNDGIHDPVSDNATVTVNDLGPTADFTWTPDPQDEGSPIAFNDASASSPDVIVSWAWDFSGLDSSSAQNPSYTFDDNGVHTVCLTVTDDDGSSNTACQNVTVNNISPTIETLTVPWVDPVDINDQASYNIDVTFIDPAGANDEPYTCAFDLDNDGVDDDLVQVNGLSCSATLNYAEPGVYTVKVTVADKDGGSDSATATQYIVIYDPEGGFVTGGGWIMSPEGAYAPDLTLSGKATFGFVSKYKKDANVPDGQTEFQFKAGDLNFHSSSYDWLVIAGASAKYKGVGTINGGGNYGFMLTATDAELTPSTDVDLFRIKIWDKDNGDVVVYDNKMGVDDDAYDGTALGGGNIKVHKK